MRIAIVGAGVSGLSALWLLNEYSEHEVNIYEKGDYIGGHTHTVEFSREGKERCQVDTGFIVLNPPTYPNFLRFLNLMKIPLLKTEMTFAVSRDRGLFEWAGEGLGGVFCQIGNIFNPRLYRMIYDILRFNLFALDLLEQEEGKTGKELSIGDYLEREGYGEGFKEDYLLPMTAAIWSTPADKAALDFPALTLIRFFHNHHLLQLTGKPKWLTVQGGSKRYVDAILRKVAPENVHLNTEIVGISSHDGGVTLEEASGQKHGYDHVILATHSDTTLSMLRRGGGLSKQEEQILSPCQWSTNEAILHWDDRFMPRRRRAYSAWNYLTSTSAPSAESHSTSSNVDTVSLTYGMNILQSIDEEKHGLVLVTLNPPFPVDEHKVVGRWTYEHPMYSNESVAAQKLLPTIQNTRNISYAGAWTSYGFHEDGFSSGLNLVTKAPFNVIPPFKPLPAKRDVPPHSLSVILLRWTMINVEKVRRLLEPAWYWVVWVVVACLVWVEGVLNSLGNLGYIEVKDLSGEVRRLRDCWVGTVDHGRVKNDRKRR